MADMTSKIGKITAYVNGDITDTAQGMCRSSYRIMLEEIVARVEERLAAVGLSATAASLRANLSADAIRNMKRALKSGDDRQGVSSNTLLALAPVLETTAAWLIEGPPPSTLPIYDAEPAARISPSGTGGKLEAFTFDPTTPTGFGRRLPAVAGSTTAYAVRVVTHAMAPSIEPGDLRVADPALPVRERDVVVMLFRSETLSPRVLATIGIYRGRTPRGAMIEQRSPQATREIDHDAIAAIHKVLSYSELITG